MTKSRGLIHDQMLFWCIISFVSISQAKLPILLVDIFQMIPKLSWFVTCTISAEIIVWKNFVENFALLKLYYRSLSPKSNCVTTPSPVTSHHPSEIVCHDDYWLVSSFISWYICLKTGEQYSMCLLYVKKYKRKKDSQIIKGSIKTKQSTEIHSSHLLS